MNTFLSSAAQRIFENYSLQSLKDLCLVLPSRRAVGFMKRELAMLSDVPFLSPKIFSIDDFVKEFSGLKVEDNLSLLFKLYEVFRKFDADIVFDDFIAWAPTVMSDFDLIDQYLVPDPAKLFSFMSEVEALKRWNVDELSEVGTSIQYFDRFETIGKVYEEFKKQLENSGSAYRGMAYRSLAEEFLSFLEENDSFIHYYFVGLNALSKSERSIITQLVANGKATCIWDTDNYFMDSEQQAGAILRSYRNTGTFGKWNEPSNYLLTESKEVNFYESSFDSLQPKIAANIVGNVKNGKTVFVVPDDNQLQSVLFSLDESFDDYNISMGIGMQQSKIVALLNDLFDLNTVGLISTESYGHGYVMRIIKNPLVQALPNTYTNLFDKLSAHIASKNVISISSHEISQLIGDKLTSLFFTPWSSVKVSFELIKSVFSFLKEQVGSSLDIIENEFFYAFQSILNKLDTDLENYPNLEISGFKLLLKELFKLEKVAFEGDPEAKVQIMSLLETRCLDFENVVFISFNEGVLPSSNKTSSLLPFEACIEFGIPIYRDQDAIMAYHFYRLMMRASKVDIIYSLSKNGSLGSKSEASRIANQLKYDLFEKNKSIKSQTFNLDFKETKQNYVSQNGITVEKSFEIVEKVKEELLKGLSPSSITQYLKCPLQFYFKRILRLKTKEEIEETFGYNVFGNWIHETLEKVSVEEIGLNKPIDQNALEKAKRSAEKHLRSIFERKYKGYEIDKGWNHIFWQMALSLIQNYYQLRGDQLKDNLLLNVFAEQKLESIIDHNGQFFKIKGTIDAVELKNENIELIDYKTGKAEPKDLNIKTNSNYLDTFLDPEKDKFRQLAIYLYLYYHNTSLFPKAVGARGRIYSFRHLSQDLTLHLPVNEVQEIVSTGLIQIVDEMMNMSTPFRQTKDQVTCSNCDFRLICNKPKK